VLPAPLPADLTGCSVPAAEDLIVISEQPLGSLPAGSRNAGKLTLSDAARCLDLTAHQSALLHVGDQNSPCDLVLSTALHPQTTEERECQLIASAAAAAQRAVFFIRSGGKHEPTLSEDEVKGTANMLLDKSLQAFKGHQVAVLASSRAAPASVRKLARSVGLG
jgi:hypothetical protein